MSIFLIIVFYIFYYILFSRFLGIAILNIVGLPGSLIGFKTRYRIELRYLIGIAITVILQLYVYFGIMIYVIEWTRFKTDNLGWSKYIIWFFCLSSLIGSIQKLHVDAKNEFKSEKSEYLNIQVDSLNVLQFVTFFVFFAFALYPKIENPLWSWVLSIKHPF